MLLYRRIEVALNSDVSDILPGADEISRNSSAKQDISLLGSNNSDHLISLNCLNRHWRFIYQRDGPHACSPSSSSCVK